MRRTRLMVIAIAATLAVVSTAGVAFASWCWSDPIVGVTVPGGVERDVTVIVGMDDSNIPKLDGPVIVTVSVPANVTARVKLLDNIIPEQVVLVNRTDSWTSGANVVLVTVRANTSQAPFPVSYQISYSGLAGDVAGLTVNGAANTDISHAANLKP